MDVNTRTSIFKPAAQGLFSGLVMSLVLALCSSTPLPSNEPLYHYDLLVRHTASLKRYHHGVYADFRDVRHEDPTIRLDDFRIVGIPSLDDLPISLTRLNMEETALLPIHYERLRAFEVVFGQAVTDELALSMAGADDFSGRVSEVLLLLQRVVSKLKQTMLRLEIDHDYETLPVVNFSSNANQVYLNMRILFAMQELEENLRETLSDFTRLRNAHQAGSL